MNQLLYVEGKDYFFIGTLCSKHFPTPKGMKPKEFLKGGGGWTQTLDKFIEAFDTPELTNIGLIVDADFKALDARFSTIIAALSKRLNRDFSKYTLNTEGVTIVEEGLPTIGIWLMPDNVNNGYLEYFVEKLIKTNFIIKKLNKNGKRENDFRRKMCLLQGNFC